MKNFYQNQPATEGRLSGISLPLLLVTALLSLMLLSSPGSSQETKAPAAAPAAANPQPEQILQQACDLLKSAKQFSFKAEVTDDRVYTGGKKLQYAFDLEAYVQRPDKLRVNAVGDLENKDFFLDGKTITLYDKTHNVYATMEVPATIDAALDKAVKEYGLRVALADLASENAYTLATKGNKHALYVGQGLVRGVKCHHLAFDRDNIQWQIWIDAGEKPLIRKFLITQKKLPAEPQWTAYFTDWNFSPQLSEGWFVYTPPQGAKQIKFISLGEAAAQQKKFPASKKIKRQKGAQ
ncbi:MAG: DUF2092 domain-containing protein [Thermodesulfobacteriota bacterium]